MQQKTQSAGGARGPEVDPELLQETMFNVLKQTAQSSLQSLDTITVLQQRRAARLNETAKALRKKLGDTHPHVLAVEGMAKSAADLKIKIGDQTKRAKSFPKLRPHEWIVFGAVRDGAGQPAAGLVVRVFDLDRKYDDLLGETETDVHGDFSAVYHERDFKESNENLPELYVMVSDAKGNQLYSSRESIRFNAGRAEYFAIRLGKPARPKERAQPAAKPAGKTSRKKGSSG